MSGYGAAHDPPHSPHRGGPISVPWVILASVLIGVGLTLVAYWLYTGFDLVYTFGIAFAVIGGLMLFDERAGADHA